MRDFEVARVTGAARASGTASRRTSYAAASGGLSGRANRTSSRGWGVLERFGRRELVNDAGIDAPMAGPGGVVLNVASAGGARPGPGISAHRASKAAVIHLTRRLAQGLGPAVRVNAISPAVVRTTFAQAQLQLSADDSRTTGEAVVIDGGMTVGGAA